MIMSRSRRPVVATLAATLSLSLCACASTPPPATPAAIAMPASTVTSLPQSVETPQQAATSGTVQISDEIRAACALGGGDAFFAFDSSALEKKDIAVLNKVATCFTTGPLKTRKMKLVGHADPRGAPDYNMELGLKRADSVATYLRRQDVTTAQTETTSRGAMDATGTNGPTWANDRRVDVMLGP